METYETVHGSVGLQFEVSAFGFAEFDSGVDELLVRRLVGSGEDQAGVGRGVLIPGSASQFLSTVQAEIYLWLVDIDGCAVRSVRYKHRSDETYTQSHRNPRQRRSQRP